jgi:excisionase family DNA binding protein
MPGTLAIRDLLVADDEHKRQAAEVVERTSDEPRLCLKVVTDSGEVVLPEHLASFVTHVINTVAQGATLQVRSMPEEVSTTVAADHLGVSRPTLMKMIREGGLPAHLVGSHHRVKWSDLEDFEAKRTADRRRAAHQLRDLGRELGD